MRTYGHDPSYIRAYGLWQGPMAYSKARMAYSKGPMAYSKDRIAYSKGLWHIARAYGIQQGLYGI